MRQARNPPCADPDTTPSKRPAGAKGLRLRPGPNIDRMSLIRYSVYGMVYGHRQPASPLVFWGRFVVGSWCAGHGGLGRVYDSVWTREGWREDPNAKANGGLSKAKGPGSGRAFILDSHTIPTT